MYFGIHNILNGITNEMLNKIIRDLRDIDMRVLLMTTIKNQNVKNTLHICDTAYELGASGINFNKIFIQGRTKNLTNIGLKSIDFECYDIATLYKDFDSVNIIVRNPNSLFKKELQSSVNPKDYEEIMTYLIQNYHEVCQHDDFENILLI